MSKTIRRPACQDCEYADPYGLHDHKISYITIKGEQRTATLRLCFDCLQRRLARVKLTAGKGDGCVRS